MRKLYGRTEEISVGGEIRLVWAIYAGDETEGYLGKKPVAWFEEHADATAFRYELPLLREEYKILKAKLAAVYGVSTRGWIWS